MLFDAWPHAAPVVLADRGHLGCKRLIRIYCDCAIIIRLLTVLLCPWIGLFSWTGFMMSFCSSFSMAAHIFNATISLYIHLYLPCYPTTTSSQCFLPFFNQIYVKRYCKGFFLPMRALSPRHFTNFFIFFMNFIHP